MCVGTCTKTCEHVCVRLHVHPNLHTYSLRVCVRARARARKRVYVCVGKKSFSNDWGSFSSKLIAIVCLVTETKGQTFRAVPGFYSASGAMDYTAVMLSAPCRREMRGFHYY